jgi:hypothetical protein
MKTQRKRTVKPVLSEKVNPEDFPGYPKYAADEDIMNRAKRVDADLESNRVETKRVLNAKQAGQETPSIDTEEEEEQIAKDEFAVTSEDLEALGPEELSLDMGADEELKHRSRPVDFTAKDLDIPGSELDDASEANGSEDEENNSYSIGGDDHNDLEENKGE